MVWYIFALISAALNSANEILIKELITKIRLREFVLTNIIIEAIVFLPLLAVFADFRVTDLQLTFLTVIALLNVISFILFVESIKAWPISELAPMENFGPLFLLLLAFAFLGETVSGMQLIGILLLVFGAVLMEIRKHFNIIKFVRKSSNKFVIAHMGATLVMWGLMAIISRSLMQEINAFTFLFYFILISAIAAWFWHVLTEGHTYTSFAHTFRKDPKFLFAKAVTGIAPWFFLLWALSLPEGLAILVFSILRVSTLFSVIVGGELFHEKYLFRRAIASLIMIAGVYLIAA